MPDDQVALESRPLSSPPVVRGTRRRVFLTPQYDPPVYNLRVHAQVPLTSLRPSLPVAFPSDVLTEKAQVLEKVLQYPISLHIGR